MIAKTPPGVRWVVHWSAEHNCSYWRRQDTGEN